MKLVTARRVAAAATATLAAGMLVASGPAQGATGNLDYSCAISGSFNFTFTFNQDTNAPSKVYLGKSFTPTYTATTGLPEGAVNIARSFGVTKFDGAIDATVMVNGSPITVHAPIKKTSVPSSGGITLKATGPMPKLKPASAGSVVYKPGNILFTVNAYKADNSTLFSLDKGKCTMPANTRTMDTVKYVRSPTRTATTARYSKAHKKVTAAAKITSTSGVGASGSVLFALYKGSTELMSATKTIAGGKASAVFSGISKKGSYKVVATYGGSGKLAGSSSSKAFTLH